MQRVVKAGKGKTRFERAANGLDHWQERATKFGFGTSLGARLPGTSSGNIPSSATYDKVYGKPTMQQAGEIIKKAKMLTQMPKFQ